MEGKREANLRFLEGNLEKKDKNDKFYFAKVEALNTSPKYFGQTVFVLAGFHCISV